MTKRCQKELPEALWQLSFLALFGIGVRENTFPLRHAAAGKMVSGGGVVIFHAHMRSHLVS